ncbi:Isopentenyl-diphosphate Delta-isomerase [Echinococcus granulosus]|uniref:isopentenyl-diphosphate Delta-isomerase n=1 Tax=Echinococcus granulosus TaxID=6210 RepID=W6UH58_ECHGR|nr:Isopentenyl-diphosphate Delta-isomerase [Echinococcus granulosus]EUB60361.1 Isopentenyl-diphosphate Delta-isomerase [Echinococcus granulosus]
MFSVAQTLLWRLSSSVFTDIFYVLNLPRCYASTVDKYQIQHEHMTKDECLVVDNFDRVLFTASKKNCHYKGGLLHRAFSLFIFRASPSTAGSLELLVQQRSTSKLTFPLLWTNSCCSHPCVNYDGETEEANALGVKRAARRKANHELGIDITRCLSIEDIHFLTRIIYSASNEPEDNMWCEREVDYLLASILPPNLYGGQNTFLYNFFHSLLRFTYIEQSIDTKQGQHMFAVVKTVGQARQNFGANIHNFALIDYIGELSLDTFVSQLVSKTVLNGPKNTLTSSIKNG